MAEKPLLFLDVDGVLSVFGFAGEGADPRDLYLVDGIPHHIPAAMGGRVKALLPAYESVWATGWGERANDHLIHMLGLPAELEVVDFATRPSLDGSGHWKLEELTARAGERAAAWIDDGMNEACEAWAAGRAAPTLLVHTDPKVGMTDAHVQQLIDWAAQISAP
ncbi:MAG: HAD domain-containing protein [Solirubrobacterales bacterium]